MNAFKPRPRVLTAMLACAGLAGLAACGGGNPFDNPDSVTNTPGVGGQKLSFIYYQQCINPIFLTPLQVNHNGSVSTSTCAGGGCHDTASGTGGAFRIVPAASGVAVTTGGITDAADVVRASDMYKNFYSSQGEVVFTDVMQSRLLTKPMINGVLHGGGLIFDSANDPNVKRITYWITHPMPQGQDEFSTAATNMFSNGDPATGTCNTD